MFTDIVFATDAKQVADAAAYLGADCIILARRFSGTDEIKKLQASFPKPGLKFKTCHVMERADSTELNRFRQAADFIAVDGASPELNKFAASNRRIDFLLQPFGSGANVFDTAIARLCTENGTKVAFPFAPFLNAKPFTKSMLLKNARLVAKLCSKFKVQCVFVSGAERAEDMRSVRSLGAFAVLLGFSAEQAKKFAGCAQATTVSAASPEPSAQSQKP